MQILWTAVSNSLVESMVHSICPVVQERGLMIDQVLLLLILRKHFVLPEKTFKCSH